MKCESDLNDAINDSLCVCRTGWRNKNTLLTLALSLIWCEFHQLPANPFN